MIRGKRVSAVIPARGGSRGIPRKNLYRLGGVTLVERAIRLGKTCTSVDVVYVSTDDPETYSIAVENGCATPHLRPAGLSTDSARTIDVIRNLVAEGLLNLDGCVLLLQPTTPLRTLSELSAVCRILDSRWDSTDAVVSVCEIDGPHPYKAQIVEDGYLRSLFGRDASVPRQSLPPTFIPNGAFYLGKTAVFEAEDTFIPSRTAPYVMSPWSSVNLDGPLDLLLLEAMIEKGIVRLEDGAPSVAPV